MTAKNAMTAMRFHSAISDKESSAEAVGQILDDLESQAGGDVKADVAFAFLTAHHREDAEETLERLWLELDPQTIVGCSADGVIGGEREIERSPGLAVLVASMPGVRVHPFHLGDEMQWRHVLSDSDALAERLGCGEQTRAVVAFGDPFTTPIGQFMTAMDEWAPKAPLIGGMASAAREPGGNVLLRNDEVFDRGMVGVSFSGPVRVETVVSQGCRPVGRPLVITRSHDNIIQQLGGKPAMELLRETVNALGEPERALLANGLFVGRVISEYQEEWGRGDFLVRNVIDVDDQTGAIGVADYVKTGQTVQFHIRDALTAGEDMTALLEGQRTAAPAAGGLLFSCNGRGERLFGRPDHDIRTAHAHMPHTPLAGFFAAGEFGPVGGRNFIHGHTASFALFRPG